MKYDNGKIAGSLLFIGGLVCIFGFIIAEALYPGYSTSENYISDLGVGPSSLVFNCGVFLFGLLVIGGAYLAQRVFDFRFLLVLMVVSGIGAMGVGLFTEDAGYLHLIFSLMTFLFGGISVILSYRVLKPPFCYFSVILGALSLLALALFASGNHLGLGKGGMERMVAYPALIWVIGFGGYLIGYSDKSSDES